MLLLLPRLRVLMVCGVVVLVSVMLRSLMLPDDVCVLSVRMLLLLLCGVDDDVGITDRVAVYGSVLFCVLCVVCVGWYVVIVDYDVGFGVVYAVVGVCVRRCVAAFGVIRYCYNVGCGVGYHVGIPMIVVLHGSLMLSTCMS